MIPIGQRGAKSSASDEGRGRGASPSVRPFGPHLPHKGGVNPEPFDPLDCDMADPWLGPRRPFWLCFRRPVAHRRAIPSSASSCWRRSSCLARLPCPRRLARHPRRSSEIETRLKPAILACGASRDRRVADAVSMAASSPPGPSGAPTRGRPDVLPTGRNFYSVDSRAVPTPAAYELGKKSAELLVRRYVQDHGEWPTSFGSDRLGHVEHAHRRRRYRPGHGADRREAALGYDLAARHRLRDHSAGGARAVHAWMSRCVFPASSAMPFPSRLRCSTRRSAPLAR
jgi:hypothetical protein